MRVKRRLRIRWFSLFFLLVLPVAAYGGVPEVSNVMVTDVTTTSFSVIWAASEASTADLEVYADENGSSLVDALITPHPIESGDDTIRMAAENNGVMKVRVTGLAPDITYYFMTITTSKSTTDTTYNPSVATFTPVTTESETVRTYESGGHILPFSNDLIIEPCYLDDGTTPAEGTLLLATVAGGNHPITAFVGDGVNSPYALIDLNNVFSRDTYENLDLSQGLNLTLLNFRGMAGNSIVTHTVPLDELLSEVKPPEFGLKAGWNFVSFQLEPGETALEIVLEPILDKVSAVWTYDTEEDKWYKYLKEDEYGVSDLDSVHSLLGYWILMEEGKEASLKVHGNFVTNESIPLYSMNSGWNLIGYRSAEVVDVGDLVGPAEALHSQVDAIWTYNTESDTWQKYLREDEYGVTDLFYLIPGKAYWVLVNSDCTL